MRRMALKGKHFLITGGAKRIGREIALHLAAKGAHIALHFNRSSDSAEEVQQEVRTLGVECELFGADLSDFAALGKLIEETESSRPLDGLVNNASIFGAEEFDQTGPEHWQAHLDVNLSAPFFLSQALIRGAAESKRRVRIVNMLDWRALRPGSDHFAYTISKAALASLTQALAAAAAPAASVNGVALGAILPPSSGEAPPDILEAVPAGRWGNIKEVTQTVEFLLAGPDYITGEIIHLDGGRHLI